MKQPLHDRIRSDFEARILAGDLAPGDRLPIEHDLISEYSCSRMTVNKAMSALAAAGLIDRRKRAGTFVTRPRVHSMVLDVPDLAAQVRNRGQTYRYAPLRRAIRPADPNDAEEWQLAGRSELLQIDGLHFADDVPLAVEYRLVSIQAVPGIGEADLSEVPPGTWLLHHVPWTEAETRISAVPATGRDAEALGVAPGTACLLVERWTWRRAERITYVRQLFLGHAYDVVARFGPGMTTNTETVGKGERRHAVQ